MKKTFIIIAMAALTVAGCGTMGTTGSTGSNDALGTIFGQLGQIANDQSAMGNVIQSVLGLDKITAKNLVGTWTYKSPGCAFTSEKLLAQAGGEVVAAEIKQKVKPTYDKLGISSQNTSVTFKDDGTYVASFAGKQISGQYTFDESTYKVTMKGLLLTINCYAKKNSDGIGLLFESSKLLSLMQTLATLSGNSTAQTIGDLSKSYDGLRLGFDFTK